MADTSTIESMGRRRWLTFSVRSLLIVILTLAIALGWYVNMWQFRLVAFDDFNDELSLEWTPVRHDPTHVSTTKRPGTLTITTQRGSIHGKESEDLTSEGRRAKNLFLVDNPVPPEHAFQVTTKLVGFSPKMKWQQAGLIFYDDDDNYAKWDLEFSHTGQCVLTFLHEQDGTSRMTLTPVTVPPSELWLRLTKMGGWYEVASSTDGKSFEQHAVHAVDGLGPQCIGIYAKNGGDATAEEIDASFEFFEIRARRAVGEPTAPDMSQTQ